MKSEMLNNFIIVGGGDISDYQYISKQLPPNAVVIAADSGYRHLSKLCLHPDFLVGDFDSIGPLINEVPKDVCRIKVPSEKDFTDMELAIDEVLRTLKSNGRYNLFIIGFSGTRLDHQLANIFLLKRIKQFEKEKKIRINSWLIDEKNKITILKKGEKLNIESSSYVSVLPVLSIAVISTKGMKYDVKNCVLRQERTIGISNEVVGENAEILCDKGLVFVFLSDD